MSDADARISRAAGRALPGLALALLLLPLPGPAGRAEGPAAGDEKAMQARVRARLLEIYAREAAEYDIFRDAGRTEKVVLRKEPVYLWSNPLRGGGQDGAVFVWTCRGRPEVVGTIFSCPGKGPRGIIHEFHALATTVLDVTRTGDDFPEAKAWKPKAPGVTMVAIEDAPAPARSPVQRLAQMRTMTADFSGTTQDDKEVRWELRLLPRPFYRYESTDPDVLDGALFGFVTSAGTDPEALLVLEARKAPGSADPKWHYAVGRYTDLALRMRHKGREILSAPFLSGTRPDDVYRVLEDRIIPPVEDGLRAAAP